MSPNRPASRSWVRGVLLSLPLLLGAPAGIADDAQTPPGDQASSQPSNESGSAPSSQPSNESSSAASSQPSKESSSEPSRQSSGKPSNEPGNQPSSQPSDQASSQPAPQPDSQPSLIERVIERLTGGDVVVRGLTGALSTTPQAQQVELRDADGAWLVIQDLALDWSPSRLVTKRLLINKLTAGRVELKRPRVKPANPSPSSGLPLKIQIQALDVARLQVDEPVAGAEAALSVAGSLNLESLEQGSLALEAQALGSAGTYHIEGDFSPETLQAQVQVDESPGGPLARLASLPDLGKLVVDASLAGPRSAIATEASIDAGPMTASAQGTVDLVDQAADLSIAASAPAMSPRADLSWQSVALKAKLSGPFKRPSADGTLRITELEAAGSRVQTLAAQVQGDKGKVDLTASLDGVVIPGPQPDLLAAAPVSIQADVQLDQPDRPVTFSLEHPLIAADGRALTAGQRQATVDLRLPELGPLAAIAGVDLQGHGQWTLKAAEAGAETTLSADGRLAVTGGAPPLPGLLGESATIAAAGSMQGKDIALSRLVVDGKTLQLSAQGGLSAQKLQLDWRLALSRLRVLDPSLSGSLSANGRVAGPTDDLAVDARLTGDLGVQDLPPSPVSVQVHLDGLPKRPSGRIEASGTVAGAPLQLAVRARRTPAATAIDIDRADWKSAHAEGRLSLATGAVFPVGDLDLRVARLADLRPFVGQPLTGAISARLNTREQGGERRATLSAEGQVAGLPGGAALEGLALDATVLDPTANPTVDASLAVGGFSAQGVSGSGRLTVNGPPDALAVDLTADARELAGAPARLAASAVVDATAKQVSVSALQASWKGEDLKLLAPARIDFAQGLSVDTLRVGVQQAVLEASGRIAPTLDLTAQVRNLSPEIAAAFVPGVQTTGTIQGDARLKGTLAKPTGTVRLEGRGLRIAKGPASALPPADLTASADLSGETARIDSSLTVGANTRVRLRGQVPLSAAGRMDLRATGSVDLALANPVLTAQGRRVRGELALDAGVAGTLSSPRLTGTARLAGGSVQDYVQGVRLTNIDALLQLQGDSIRIARLSAQAGPGSLSASGSVGVLRPGVPIDATITARNARPLSGDLLTVNLDADVTARGQLTSQFLLAGDIRINKAEIRVPETLPTSVATLDVRLPGQKSAPPPAPGPTIALNLWIKAPRQIFVRGRGLDAELGGRVRVQGTVADPRPLGSFELLRGDFTLASQTLQFSKGQVSFNGGSLTDPSIDFVVSATNGDVTAQINVGGTVKEPKISMTSTPELPQDEVLSQLLFGRPVSALSPFEIAQIAAALGQLVGANTGNINPLSKVREALGLSRLTIGTTATGRPALEAGRYVQPNVYVGVEQGAATGSTSAKVEVDLSKHVKLQGTVGTGFGSATGATDVPGSSIGVLMQWEY